MGVWWRSKVLGGVWEVAGAIFVSLRLGAGNFTGRSAGIRIGLIFGLVEWESIRLSTTDLLMTDSSQDDALLGFREWSCVTTFMLLCRSQWSLASSSDPTHDFKFHSPVDLHLLPIHRPDAPQTPSELCRMICSGFS